MSPHRLGIPRSIRNFQRALLPGPRVGGAIYCRSLGNHHWISWMGQGQMSQVDCEYPNFFAVTDLSASILRIRARVGKKGSPSRFLSQTFCLLLRLGRRPPGAKTQLLLAAFAALKCRSSTIAPEAMVVQERWTESPSTLVKPSAPVGAIRGNGLTLCGV